jgi:PAS domain S-box-containing protein
VALGDLSQGGSAGFLSGGGEMGALMRAHDWSDSPLGPPEGWPESLRAVVALMINSRFPMFIAWGPELAFLYNDAYAPIFGAKHPHMLGRPFREAWSEIWEDLLPLIERALAGEPTFNEDLHLVMERNGYPEDTWYSFSYSPVRDESGSVAGMFCACMETSQQVLAARKLSEQRERQQRLFQKAPGFIAILRGRDHVFEFVNEAYVRLIGGRDPTGLAAREALPEVEGQGFFELLDTVYSSGERYRADGISIRLRRTPEGASEERFLDFIYEPIIDESGRVTGIFVEGHDVTEARGVQQALRASEERYRQIVEGAEEFAIVTLDDQGTITGWNSGAERIMGFSPEEALGQPSSLFFTPEDRAAGVPDHEINRAYVDGQAQNERWHIRKDGSRFWGSGLIMRLEDSGGYLKIFRDRTVEHQAEAELRRSEERFREQFENANDYIFTADLEMRIVEGNPAIAAALGTTPEELTGRSIAEFLPPEMHERSKQMFASKLSGGSESTRYETQVYGAEGQLMTWEINSRLTRNHEGAPTGLHAIARDVSERRRAEDALRESEARLRALTDHLPGGMVYQIATGADGAARRFVYVSQSHEQLTGISAEAVLQDPAIPYQLIHPDDRGTVAAAEGEAIRTRTFFDVQARFRRADGELRWCRIISAPREQADGSLIWDGIQIDITDQKRIEAELRDREAQLRLVTESLPVLISYVDADCRYLFANKAYEGWFDISRDQVIGRTMAEVLGEKAFEQIRPSVEAVLRGDRQAFERELPYQYGVSRYVHVDYVPNWLDGQVIGFYALVNDVTEAKRIEHALRDSETRLRELNETLERRVEERTDELIQAQEQLRQSQKLEAMGQLTGGVAHDFNNLLTPIIGCLDLLKRRGLGGDREQRLIDGGLQSAERAKTLVQRLLAFARRQPLKSGAVDVASLVAGMADLIASTSGPQVRLVVNVAEELPAALADPNQLEMAILNLSVNARDAMPNGGTLTISAAPDAVGASHRSQLKPGDYLRLSVADTGVGMDEATLARAIEPFFSTKGIGKGTGLGLSMVHGLAAQLGGGFAISSRPGLGTCVDLWLPLTERSAAEPEEAGPRPAAGRGRGTALLVDDEDLVRISTADMLSELGYQVVEAACAADALVKLGDGLNIDLLVTDHMMPGMSGADLAREVRDRRPGLPVLIVSGYAEAEGVAPDLPRLTKPFRQADLAATLSSLAGGDPGSA